MGVLDVLRGVVDNDSFTVCECRDCGEKLSDDVDECPTCESEEVVRYEF